MNQTILLGNGAISNVTLSRWTNIFLGIIFILNGLNTYYSDNLGYIEYGLMVANFSVGVYAIIYALIALSKFSIFSPKVKLSDSLIHFKSAITKKSKTLAWSEVKKIQFQAYSIEFILDKETVEFSYRSNAKVSKRIKDALRKVAETKNIEVTGG
jgi:hypothetical protein